jgi:hypothetical protein
MFFFWGVHYDYQKYNHCIYIDRQHTYIRTYMHAYIHQLTIHIQARGKALSERSRHVTSERERVRETEMIINVSSCKLSQMITVAVVLEGDCFLVVSCRVVSFRFALAGWGVHFIEMECTPTGHVFIFCSTAWSNTTWRHALAILRIVCANTYLVPMPSAHRTTSMEITRASIHQLLPTRCSDGD